MCMKGNYSSHVGTVSLCARAVDDNSITPHRYVPFIQRVRASCTLVLPIAPFKSFIVKLTAASIRPYSVE